MTGPIGSGGFVIQAPVFAQPSTLIFLTAHNKSAVTVYVQVHDKATAISASEVPLFEFQLAANTSFGQYFGQDGVPFRNGCQVGASTTNALFTASATSDILFCATTRGY